MYTKYFIHHPFSSSAAIARGATSFQACRIAFFNRKDTGFTGKRAKKP
jgi:hypothetical protein